MSTTAGDTWLRWFEHRLREHEATLKLQGDHWLLDLTLMTAVPLWQERHASTPEDRRIERARALSGVIGAHGDDILYRSKKPGETARAFNALAEGLALMSYVPGGVTFLGRHWEAR